MAMVEVSVLAVSLDKPPDTDGVVVVGHNNHEYAAEQLRGSSEGPVRARHRIDAW